MPEKHILVIDDNVDVRAMLCATLRDCGYQVEAAANGEEGLCLVDERNLPDLVITDILMPRKDGIETIMELRGKYPRLKLLAISGGNRTRVGDFLGMAQKLGSDAVMQKPLDMKELEATVARLLA